MTGTSLQLAYEAKAGAATDYYVFNRGTDAGFIIVSGDDMAVPVLGYSDRGAFNLNNLPDNVRWWMQQYQEQMQYLRKHPESARRAAALTASVAPLMTTTWKQSMPYNEEIPTARFARGTQRPIVGCVALAMAQLMKAHNWPTTGEGSHSYQWTATNEYGENATSATTYSANFGATTYQWASMKDSYSASASNATAVATLCYHCGVAVNMQYGVAASGAQIYDAALALKNYFRYDKGLDLYMRDFYEADEWDAMLRADLDEGLPILYGGSTQASEYAQPSGHCFVFDGYDTTGKFHINWGWGGNYDGYFATSLLDSGRSGANFSNWQQAVLGIRPDRTGTSSGTSRPLTGYMIDFAMGGNQVAVGGDAAFTMDGVTFLGEGDISKPWWGVVILSEDEKTVVDAQYIVNAEGIEIGATYSADDEAALTVPAGIAPGVYHIRAMYTLDEDNTRHYFERPPVKSKYIKMTVSGGVAYFSEGDMDDPQPERKKGDLTGDGVVDVSDVNLLINIILGAPASDDLRAASDLTGEGAVDVSDVNALINIILN